MQLIDLPQFTISGARLINSGWVLDGQFNHIEIVREGRSWLYVTRETSLIGDLLAIQPNDTPSAVRHHGLHSTARMDLWCDTPMAGKFQMVSGIDIEEIKLGTGPEIERGQTVSVRWKGTLNHGDSFGEGEVSFRAGGREVVAGLSRGVIGMRVGGIRRLRVSPHLGYRDQAVPGIPPNAVLTFQVEMLGVGKCA